MTRTVTLNVQQENGEFKKTEVSEDFMELCYHNAESIVRQAESADDIIRLVEETSSDNTTRSIICDMIQFKLNIRAVKQDLMIHFLKDMLGM